MSVPNHDSAVHWKGLINLEYERKKEFERRRKLRLIQVREQSKDFASKIRKNVETESKLQHNKALERSAKELQEKRIQEINLLKEKYQKCLEQIGEGHLEAAKQPSVELIKEAEMSRNEMVAALRAAKARKLQLEQEAVNRKMAEAPIKQKKITRMKENIRSGLICSLPKPSERQLSQQTDSHQKHQSDGNQPKPISRVLQDLPTNLQTPRPVAHSTVSAPLRTSDGLTNRGGEERLQPVTKEYTKSAEVLPRESANDCSCDYIVCVCHDSPKSLRRCSSEANVSILNLEEKEKSPEKRNLRSRSFSPLGGRSVRTLNHCDVGNLYEGTQPSCARVTHHSTLEEPKEKNVTVSKPLPARKTISKEELKKKTEERSAKALQREQLKRNFQKLLKDLEILGRNRALQKNMMKSKAGVFQRQRDIVAKNEAKQRKLADAFDTLLHSTGPPQTQSTGLSLPTEELETEDTSPRTLNLASYHQMDIPRSKNKPTVSYDDVEILPTSPIPSSSQMTSAPRSPNKMSPSRTIRSLSPKQPSGSSGLSTIKSQDEVSDPSNNLEAVKENDKKQPSSTALTGTKSPEPSCPTTATSDLAPKRREDHSKHKKKCKKKQSVPHMDSSTSYYSPPEYLSPSQKCFVEAFFSKLKKKGINVDLRKYIFRLLSMSRYSIDNLSVLSSSSEHLDTVRESMEKETEEDIAKLSELTELYVDKFNTLVEMFEQITPPESPVQFLSLPRKEIPSQNVPRVNLTSDVLASQPIATETLGPISSRQDPSHLILSKGPSPLGWPLTRDLSPSSWPQSKSPPPDSDSRRHTSGTRRSRVASDFKDEPQKNHHIKQTSSLLRLNNSPLSLISLLESDLSSISQTERFQVPQSQESPLTTHTNVQQGENNSGVDVDNPFGLKLNLLPHPEEVFKQQLSRSPQLTLSPLKSDSPKDNEIFDDRHHLGSGDGNFRVQLEESIHSEICDPSLPSDRKGSSFDNTSTKQPDVFYMIKEIKEKLSSMSSNPFGEIPLTSQMKNIEKEQTDSKLKDLNPSPDLHVAEPASHQQPGVCSPKIDSGSSPALSVKSSKGSLTDIDVNKSIALNIAVDTVRKDRPQSDNSDDSYVQTNFESIDW